MQTTNENGTFSLRNAHARRIAGVIVPLFFFSILLSGALLSAANDMYAFVKPHTPCTLSVESPLPLKELADRLQEAGVLENPYVFSLYVRTKGKEERAESFVGDLSLSSDMSYREILLALAKSEIRE